MALDIVMLMREGWLVTSGARKYVLEEIGPAVMHAEARGRQGKILFVPEQS